MSVNNHNDVLQGIKASLATAIPARYFETKLVQPANETAERLTAGVVCVVSERGGNFANTLGREGDLGTMEVSLVCFLKVDESTEPDAIQTAELQLLGDLLTWLNTTGVPGLDVIYPTDWHQSKQLEHPYGWLLLKLDVKT